MKLGVLLLWTVAAVSARMWAQEPGYPITVVPPGKGPYQFPQGYQTPWDKIEMLVTEKLAPNLYSVHGSAGLDPAHPDAAGGRVAVLFGSDGVLMVDTQDPQLAAKTLDTIRTFTSAPIKIVVNSHIHSDHTGGNAFFAKQGAVIYSQENLRDEMLSPPGQVNADPRPRFRRRSNGYVSVRLTGCSCRHDPYERRNGGLYTDDAVPHRG
jgi:glyoxylase-like metal-dependent hydrolase (beta-lactamase superfamily II)